MTSGSDTMFPIYCSMSKGSRFKEEHKANGSLSIWQNAWLIHVIPMLQASAIQAGLGRNGFSVPLMMWTYWGRRISPTQLTHHTSKLVPAIGSSPCGLLHRVAWASSQHGGWLPSVSVPRKSGDSCIALDELASEVTWSHFHHRLSPPTFKGSFTEEHKGHIVRRTCGMGDGVAAIPENIPSSTVINSSVWRPGPG